MADALGDELDETYSSIREYQDADLSQYEIGAQIIDFTEQAETMFIDGDLLTRRKMLELCYSNLTLHSGSLITDIKEPFYTLAERFISKSSGVDGFEPSIQAPKARALPLGHAPAYYFNLLRFKAHIID